MNKYANCLKKWFVELPDLPLQFRPYALGYIHSGSFAAFSISKLIKDHNF